MVSARKLIPQDQKLLSDNQSEAYYFELTHRNGHFISHSVQKKLKSLKVLVAGCGAAGGACTAPLARLGVTHFRIADNGYYEISNLNRQHTFVDRLGENKAEFHASELRRINPHLEVESFAEGITLENVTSLVEWADIIIDTVDVTNPISIQMKFRLHQESHRCKKPVISPLDPGFCQMGVTYDYRNSRVQPLNGKLEECMQTKNPLKGLFTMFSIDDLPVTALPLVKDLLENPQKPASQMGASADMLSGVIAAVITRFADTGTLINGWYYNLDAIAYSPFYRFNLWIKSFRLRSQIKTLLYKLA